MKKFKILILLLIGSFSLKAQSQFNNLWDSIYREVKVPGSLNTGYFWNLGVFDSSIYLNQGLSSDASADFEQLSLHYQQFYNSSIQTSQSIQPYEEFQKNLELQFKANTIAVPILFLQGGMFNEAAYTEGRIQFDSTNFKWQVNSPQDAFRIHEVFIAAPYVPVSFNAHINLFFSDEFVVNNSGSPIKRIQIKFRNESFREVQMNVPMSYLLLPGDNDVLIQVSFLNGKIRESKTTIGFETRDLMSGILNKHDLNNPFHFGDASGNIYTDPDRETELKEPLGAFIDYLPGYKNGVLNTCIGKPIVIVEGIDFGFKDHWTDSYGGKYGSTGLIDLVNGYVLNPYASKQKDRIEPWAAIEKAPQFLSELRNKGYDVFYIDFHNGADYMENNAMLVVKFIQMLNQKKCSDEEIVLVGASMGGVIAKYALSYMEKNKLPHCVRTYLSFDAPHQGANISYGLQSFMDFYRGKLPTVKENFKRKIDRAASRQLLKLHILSDVTATPHKDRNDFLAKQALNGNYPKYSRNIALTNGSVDASFQNFNPGDVLLTLGPISANINNNPFKFTSNVFALSYKYQKNVWSKPVNIAFFSDISYGLKHYVPLNIEVGEDHIPGSVRYDLRDFRKIYGVFNIVNNHSSTCFIPSSSALDAELKFGHKIDDQVDRYAPNPSVYPFQTFYGVEKTNEEHMQLTDANIQWMIDEFEKNANEVGPVLGTNYNYGRFERKTLPSVNVYANGKLQINGHGLNGYGSGTYDRMNRKGSTFEMSTSECNSLVLIDQNGVLELGDKNPENNKAILRIRKGCVLMLKSGSTLLIHNNSQLIIEAGAELIYFPGAKIQLEGNEATLQIDGKLRLETGAVFTFTKGVNEHTGYVKFRNAKGGYGEGSVEIGGDNVQFALLGTNKSSDVVLQVEGEMSFISPKGTHRLKGFSLEKGKVLYGNSSSIKLDADVKLDQVEFDQLPWAVSGSSNALVLENSKAVSIDNCQFSNLNFGLKYLGSKSDANLLDIKHSNFVNCQVGMYGHESILKLDYCTFNSNIEYGVYWANSESDLQVLNSSFNHNGRGISLQNRTSLSRYAFVESCDFGNNSYGMDAYHTQIAIACSRFIANEIGVQDEDGVLNLGTDQTFSGVLYSGNGGNNTFAYNKHSGIQVKGSLLFLNNGRNNFIHTAGNTTCNFVLGDVAYSQATHEQSIPYKLKATDNYWMDKPMNNNISNGSMTLYFVKFPYPGSNGMTLNYFSGNVMNDWNKTCFTGSSCNPCGLVTNETKNSMGDKPMQNDSIKINLYPFPASDYFEFELLDAREKQNLSMKLMDIQGRILVNGALTESKVRISTADFANGIYLLEISANNQKIQKRILVNHAW